MKVTTTPKASRDLDEWIGRIAENNPLAAEAFQNRIRQCIEVIRSHPEAGRRHPKRRGIRKLVEDPIVIYYEVFEDQIEILRFWHSARNPRSISLSLAAIRSRSLLRSRVWAIGPQTKTPSAPTVPSVR